MSRVSSICAFVNRYDRRLWVLFLVQMSVGIGFGTAMPFISLFFYQELGVSMKVVGSVMLLAGLTSSLGRIGGGELADRYGRRLVLVFVMLAQSLGFLLIAYLVMARAHYFVIAVAFIAIRATRALILPVINAMVADIAGPRLRVEAFSLLRIGRNIGWATGPALGGFLYSLFYFLPFAVTAGPCLIALVLILMFATETIVFREEERFNIRQMWGTMSNRGFLIFCVISFLLFLVMGQFSTTLSVFSVGILGISTVQLGLLYTLNGVICILFQWPATLLARRLGVRFSLVLGSLLFTIGYFSVGIVPSFYFLLGSMFIITLGEVTHGPTSIAAVANMSTTGRVGRYLGFYGFTEALGWSVGPFIGGFLLDASWTSPTIIWGSVAGLGLIATVGFFLSFQQG